MDQFQNDQSTESILQIFDGSNATKLTKPPPLKRQATVIIAMHEILPNTTNETAYDHSLSIIKVYMSGRRYS